MFFYAPVAREGVPPWGPLSVATHTESVQRYEAGDLMRKRSK